MEYCQEHVRSYQSKFPRSLPCFVPTRVTLDAEVDRQEGLRNTCGLGTCRCGFVLRPSATRPAPPQRVLTRKPECDDVAHYDLEVTSVAVVSPFARGSDTDLT
jgi:hypothetical protein